MRNLKDYACFSHDSYVVFKENFCQEDVLNVLKYIGSMFADMITLAMDSQQGR